jgi:formylglycine-generating enzyme required for sulfatase activity
MRGTVIPMFIIFLLGGFWLEAKSLTEFCSRFNSHCDAMGCAMSPVAAERLDLYEEQFQRLEDELYKNLDQASQQKREEILTAMAAILGARDRAQAHYRSLEDLSKLTPEQRQNLDDLHRSLAELEAKLSANPVHRRALDQIKIVRERLRFLRAGLRPSAVLTVPGGRYKMGKEKVDVSLRSFMAASTHITQGEWKQLSGGENPSHFKGEEKPVEQVSWASVVMYTIKLNEKLGLESPVDLSQMDATKWSGRWEDGTLSFNGDESNMRIDTSKSGYRLPSEAEYEYMQRNLGTTDGEYPHNLTEGELKDYFVFDEGTTADVKSKQPLLLEGREIYDLGGNVWTWLLDGYQDNRNGGENPVQNPGSSSRVVRGGSWYYDAQTLRLAIRDGFDAVNRSNSVGLRLVRTLP